MDNKTKSHFKGTMLDNAPTIESWSHDHKIGNKPLLKYFEISGKLEKNKYYSKQYPNEESQYIYIANASADFALPISKNEAFGLQGKVQLNVSGNSKRDGKWQNIYIGAGIPKITAVFGAGGSAFARGFLRAANAILKVSALDHWNQKDNTAWFYNGPRIANNRILDFKSGYLTRVK